MPKYGHDGTLRHLGQFCCVAYTRFSSITAIPRRSVSESSVGSGALWDLLW